MASFQQDQDAFYSDQVAPGTVVDLGGGARVTKMGDGTAVYEDSSGRRLQYDKNTDPSYIASNAPGLKAHWDANYQVGTNSPGGGAQTRTDPAASGFTVNADGTVTRKGSNPNVPTGEMYGDYQTKRSINDVQDPEARAYYQANPDKFLAVSDVQGLDPDTAYRKYYYGTLQNSGSGGASSGGAGVGGSNGTGTGTTGGTAGTSGTSGLSLTQQSLLKALMDQSERDGITDEMRANANELYGRNQNFENKQIADTALYTGGNAGIYNRYQGDIENDVGRAVADTRTGQTAALNTAARQAQRYGVSMPSTLGSVSSAQASQLAAAANGTRNDSIANYRSLVGQGIGMTQDTFRTGQAATADAMNRGESASMAGRNLRIQDDSMDWAKQLDVTGMARGMPGASQGAYGVAMNAGNSAVQNQSGAGQALIGAMGQSNNTTMQGRQIAMQGTTGVLNAQANYANTMANQDSGLGGLGSILGGGASLITAFSDRRLKENIELVGRDPRTGLNIYEFSYIDDPDRRRFEGVMSDEVRAYLPSAVSVDPQSGFDRVNYQALGLTMKEVA